MVGTHIGWSARLEFAEGNHGIDERLIATICVALRGEVETQRANVANLTRVAAVLAKACGGEIPEGL
jgi:hypothetical protein